MDFGWLAPVAPQIVTALSTLAAAFLGGYFGHRWTLERELAKVRTEERIRTYRELRGIAPVLEDLSWRLLETAIYVSAHRRAWLLGGGEEPSYQLDEHRAWVHVNLDVRGQLNLAVQRLQELLATASVVFPPEPELSALIDAAQGDPGLVLIEEPGPDATPEMLPDWQRRALDAARVSARGAYKPRLEALTEKLKPMVREHLAGPQG